MTEGTRSGNIHHDAGRMRKFLRPKVTVKRPCHKCGKLVGSVPKHVASFHSPRKAAKKARRRARKALPLTIV